MAMRLVEEYRLQSRTIGALTKCDNLSARALTRVKARLEQAGGDTAEIQPRYSRDIAEM